MKIGTLIHPSRLAAVLASSEDDRILTPLVEQCAALGATHIELTGELFTLAPPVLIQRLREEIRGPLAALRKNDGLAFSVHLPAMGGLDISSSVEAIRTASLDTFQTIAKITEPLAPENYILHVSGMIQEATNTDVVGSASSPLYRLLLDNALRCLDRMADFLIPEKICIENLPSFPMDFLAPFVQDGHVSVCLDVGHLALRGESLDTFLARYAGRVREVHLHDVKRVQHGPNVLSQVDHMALGKGSLDLDRIVRTLCSHDFSGPVVLEVLRGDGLSSIERLKQLLQETGGLP